MRAISSSSNLGRDVWVWEECHCRVFCNRLWCDQLWKQLYTGSTTTNSELLNMSKFFSFLGSMCSAACIDEAIIASISKCASSRGPSIFPRHFHCVRVGLSYFERLFACTLGFPRLAFLRDLQDFLCHTLGFPRHAEQNNFQSLYFFLPRSTLESLLYSPGFKGYSNNFSPTDTPCRETRQHAFAFTIGEPVEELSWDLFDISDCFPAERKGWFLEKWLQESVVSFMM